MTEQPKYPHEQVIGWISRNPYVVITIMVYIIGLVVVGITAYEDGYFVGLYTQRICNCGVAGVLPRQSNRRIKPGCGFGLPCAG